MESNQSRAQKHTIVIVQLASGLVHDIVVCSESQSDRYNDTDGSDYIVCYVKLGQRGFFEVED